MRAGIVLAQLLGYPVTLRNVVGERCFEGLKQLVREHRIVLVAFQPGNDLALPADMALAFCNVLFGLPHWLVKVRIEA